MQSCDQLGAVAEGAGAISPLCGVQQDLADMGGALFIKESIVLKP